MPGARRLDDIRELSGRWARKSDRPGAREKVRYRAERSGRYYVQVKISEPGNGHYTLKLVRK
jgi:hypothetical protein